MLEQLKNAPIMTQGYFVAGFGLLGVFIVLVLFYYIIKLMHFLPDDKGED